MPKIWLHQRERILTQPCLYDNISFVSPMARILAGRSAVWLARLPWEQEVGGSNPLAPTRDAEEAGVAQWQSTGLPSQQ